nr:MAG TPA_asm: major capsid protein [Caudoviricetes sp.]
MEFNSTAPIMAAQFKKQQPLKLDIQFFADGDDPKGGAPTDTKTAELLTEIKTASQGFAKSLQQMQEDIKAHGQTSDETNNRVNEMEKKYTQLVEDYKKMQRLPGGSSAAEAKSAGERFIESDEYKQFLTNGEKKSRSMEIKGFFRKDLTSAAASAGTLVMPQRQSGIITEPEREVWLRDLMNVGRTTSNAIEFVQETGFTNNAAPVAEGALKPQSELTFDSEITSVKTIAHWVAATRQIIADAPQLQSYIDNRLRYGLKLEEEQQILYGDGTGDNLQGIMVNPNIQDVGGVGALAPEGTTDNILDHLRRSMTRVLLAGYPATGVALNPLNWEQIELMKADNGQYLWLNIGDTINPRLFRLPVAQTVAMAENDFLIGAFGLGAQLWDREQANVRLAEEHTDFFTRNMVAILAEERLALTMYRPEAFVTGTLTPEPAGV